jgi:hypothetical protein
MVVRWREWVGRVGVGLAAMARPRCNWAVLDFLMLPPQEPEKQAPAAGALELAHVLFLDIVSYCLLLMDAQREAITKLQNIVRATPQFIAAEKTRDVIALPTGDGMALIFFGDPTRAAECALGIARALKSEPKLPVRMGLHTGPVYRMADINTNLNVSGGGINIAQRVMDAGGAGQILVSSAMADVLAQVGQWKEQLVDFGIHAVKHGLNVHFYNLYTGELGVAELPAKWGGGKKTRSRRKALVVSAAGLCLLAAAAVIWWEERPAPVVPERELDYSITVQRFKDGEPFREPFQLASEVLFEEDCGIAINVSSPAPGYLYILNDGPQKDGRPSINVLYPRVKSSAALPAARTVRVPETKWFTFDQASGTETLYLIWSEASAPEFEALKDTTSSMQNGLVAIKDPARIDAVRASLARLLLPASHVQKDDAARRTVLRSSASTFAHLIRLEHH